MKKARKHLHNFIDEISNRGGEIEILHSPRQGVRRNQCETRGLHIADTGRSERRKVWLLRCEGWRFYSSNYGARPAHLAYLCGYDDNGAWAIRVPGTVKTARDAIDWVTPKEVSNARVRGKRVLRQGDIYAVETTRAHDGAGADLIVGHRWYPRARVLLHDGDQKHAQKHAPLVINYPVKFVSQRAYQMGRGNGGAYAD